MCIHITNIDVYEVILNDYNIFFHLRTHIAITFVTFETKHIHFRLFSPSFFSPKNPNVQRPRHWNEACMDQTFSQGVLLALHKLRLRFTDRKVTPPRRCPIERKTRFSFAEQYACVKHIICVKMYIKNMYMIT